MSDDLATFRLVCPSRYEASGRREADYYPTPAWCVEALIRHCPPPKNMPIVEPSAGEGHIVRALGAFGRRVALAVEIRPECESPLCASPCDVIAITDWLRFGASQREHAIVGNPPYTIAEKFVRHTLDLEPAYCALLLPLGFLASQERYAFWHEHPLTRLVVLSQRPSFTGDGKTDSTDYAWFVWCNDEPGIEWALPGEVQP